MKEGNITFNSETGRYEIDGCALTCGTCLEIWNGEKWLSCRVEYNDNWDRGYYLMVFKGDVCTGTIPIRDKVKGRM